MRDKLGDKARLQHILAAIEAIENYTEGIDFDGFVANAMMFDATLRQLEIIGEASNRVSDELCQNTKHIPWRQMVGLRNLVIHEYFGIDDLTIWTVISTNLPDVKRDITALTLTL
jgi:uncharacterized protein with HEPN domain